MTAQRQIYCFSLRLLTNTIVSQSSATSGDHQCLDFIPGATLLGVAASRLYHVLSSEQSDLLFHSGAVRFTDALPSSDAEPAWPVPLCWHQTKGQSIYLQGSQGKQVDANTLFDPSRKLPEPGQQPKQLRAGHITASGQMITVEKDYDLKTAINPETGSAAESQLFGYQSLKAGQVFRFSIVADAKVEAGLLAQLAKELTGQVFIGRSRSAQFGQASIETVTAPQLTIKPSADKQLRLWLLSDLVLLDDNGNSLLTPTAEALGLPEGSQWQVEKSFIRTRSYTPFNAKRRTYDMQRQVISRGSVLVFSLPHALTIQEQEALQFSGLHQEAGLGHIWVNPELLATPTPEFVKLAQSKAVVQKVVVQPNSLLARVLQKKQGAVDTQEQVELYAKALVVELQQALASAARWAGLPNNSYPTETPKRTQWGEIRSLALTYSKEPNLLIKKLFTDEHALMRARDGQSAWRLAINANEVLADRVRQALESSIPPLLQGQALAHACTQLMSDKRLSQAQQGDQQ